MFGAKSPTKFRSCFGCDLSILGAAAAASCGCVGGAKAPELLERGGGVVRECCRVCFRPSENRGNVATCGTESTFAVVSKAQWIGSPTFCFI